MPVNRCTRAWFETMRTTSIIPNEMARFSGEGDADARRAVAT